ncbi:MAG: hypothetical protein M1812_000444 [Candelaria pacifica]|nr:MAG: hypothetical protein M1812_000444 [Candelaria pacifica]
MPSGGSARAAKQAAPALPDDSTESIIKPSTSNTTSNKMTLSNSTLDYTEEQPSGGNDGELLQTYKAGFENLRSLITCRICVRLLYEPYMIGCGHTFCYSCLCQWFVNNKRNKTCPDCRAPVDRQPAPAYLVREMTEIFIARPELMPSGETKEEHRKWQKEESDIVEQDKVGTFSNMGGLFKGCFKSKKQDAWAIRDEEDGVQRCPTCTWELEDGECGRCGLTFDNDGRPITGEGFSDLSEDDDQSVVGFSSEDLDDEVDMEDQDVGLGPDWDDYDSMAGDEPISFPYPQHRENYAIQRAVAQGAIAPPLNRRSAAHSAAAGRPESDTASMSSDMQVSEDGEMGTLEEESEDDDNDDDDDDEVDGSLDGFLVQDGSDQSQASSEGNVIQQPSGFRQRRRGTGALSESLASGSQGHSTNNEDGSDEGGAVLSGRRRMLMSRPQAQLPRRLGRRGPIALSVSTEANEESRDLGEDTQALLQSGWSPLYQETAEDGMSGFTDDEDDDSRTTVGIPSSTNSDRVRLGGSLTPTAEASLGVIRPDSHIRNRNGNVIDGSRGLRRRRRSSTVSAASSTLTYEDGEAGDDDSDEGSTSIDQDGDVEMEGTPQRNLGATEKKVASGVNVTQSTRNGRGHGESVGNAIDLEVDSASDASVPPTSRRRAQRSRQPEYNPMISAMFAQHQNEAHDIGSLAARTAWDHPRARTPATRPRTANRNRSNFSTTPTQAPPFSPLSTSTISPSSPTPISSSPSRPLRDFSAAVSGNTARIEAHASPQSSGSATRSELNRSDNLSRQSSASRNGRNNGTLTTYRVSSVSSNGSTGLSNRSMSGPEDASPGQTSNSDHAHVEDEARNAALSGHGALLYPATRASMGAQAAADRPLFSQGRDLSTSISQRGPPSGSLVSPTPGLNFAARSLQARNPWAGYVRPRQSSARIREQTSTATLRPEGSRRELGRQPSQSSIREAVQPYTTRPQPSRTTLRSAPSFQRPRGQAIAHSINPIGSNTTAMHTPIVTGDNATMAGQRNSPSAPPRLSQEERQRRGNEMVRRRAEELERQNSNPFASSLSSRDGITSSAAHSSQHHKAESRTHLGQSQRRSLALPSSVQGSANLTNLTSPV